MNKEEFEEILDEKLSKFKKELVSELDDIKGLIVAIEQGDLNLKKKGFWG